MLEFMVALLNAEGLFSARSVNYSILPTLVKMLILEADYFLSLVIHSKLLPLLSAPITEPFREWLKPAKTTPPLKALRAK